MGDLENYTIEEVNVDELYVEMKQSRSILRKILVFICKILCVPVIPLLAFLAFIFTSIGIVVKMGLGVLGLIYTLCGIFFFFKFDFSSGNLFMILLSFGIGFVSFILSATVDIIGEILYSFIGRMIDFVKS